MDVFHSACHLYLPYFMSMYEEAVMWEWIDAFSTFLRLHKTSYQKGNAIYNLIPVIFVQALYVTMFTFYSFPHSLIYVLFLFDILEK